MLPYGLAHKHLFVIEHAQLAAHSILARATPLRQNLCRSTASVEIVLTRRTRANKFAGTGVVGEKVTESMYVLTT